ncbi:TOMM precursor leader peptide-binding protein [Nocardia sp. NPDC051832]|uniref:TOMM precursor leader peptide-binding protein n=1 Tax=Nocardia sp. NPDC051832 TaxID=3155673 RepID=UPI00341B18BA
MPNDIAVLGTGLLADAVRMALGEQLVRDFGRCTVLVVADDGSGAMESAAGRHAGLPWFPVRVDHDRVLIGPGGLPGRPGCPTCADRRREHNRPDAAQRAAVLDEFGDALAQRHSPLLIETTAAAAASIAAAEIPRLLDGNPSTRQWSILLETGHISSHPVMADPFCPDCAELPDDTPQAARLVLRSTPKPHPETFRSRDLAADLPELERLYVDADTGMVRALHSWTTTGGPAARAAIAPEEAPASSHGYGRGPTAAATRAAAVAEALERLGGQRPRGRRTVVHAGFAEIADSAVDPVSFGLYSEDRYATPGFRFRRYHPDLKLDWVWAYSFRSAKPVLVPECLAYYANCGATPGIVYDTSNGCAVGSSLVEAALYGLLEIAERDAFLLTWYARLPVPRVDLDSAVDRRIPLLAQRIRTEFGYQLVAFDCTTEVGIPSYWLMAIDANPTPSRPRVLCGAAAHLLPERALLGGIQELLTMFTGFLAGYDQDAAAELVVDGGKVRDMEDHGALYAHPAAFERFGFLPIDSAPRPIRASNWPLSEDLSDDLSTLVKRFLACGLDVLVVDQTGAEHRAGGFACAKVLVPGALPMTFGHLYRRDYGLPRILRAPRLLGYADRNLAPAEINPHPHPFP